MYSPSGFSFLRNEGMRKTRVGMMLCVFILISSCTQYTKDYVEDELGILIMNDLPYNFLLAFDVYATDAPDYAKTFTARYLEFEADRILDSLIKGDIVTIEQSVFGPLIEVKGVDTVEYIIIYNDLIKGGMSYTLYKNNISLSSAIEVIFPNNTCPDGVTQQLQGFSMRRNYPKNAELNFLPLDEAIEKVLEILNDIGFPEMELEVSHALDYVTLNEQYSAYINDPRTENAPLISFAKEDELYYFQFRQIIDGIPLSNNLWEDGTRARQGAETIINVFLSKNGIESIYSIGLCVNTNEGAENRLLSKKQAINLLINEYTNVILQSEHRVESMELCYVVLSTNEELELVPAWVFLVASEAVWTDPSSGLATLVVEYRYRVFNAVTGEIIRKAG